MPNTMPNVEVASTLAALESIDIVSLARAIQAHVDQHWDAVFRQIRPEIEALYAKIGDSAYSLYGTRLFRPVRTAMKAHGLKATPSLPGHLMSSREWGPENERQRWMWSKITMQDGSAIGTIATAFFHDHEQIRIPRPFQILGLEAVAKRDVIRELSSHFPEFAHALDMKAEVAAYMAQLDQQT